LRRFMAVHTALLGISFALAGCDDALLHAPMSIDSPALAASFAMARAVDVPGMEEAWAQAEAVHVQIARGDNTIVDTTVAFSAEAEETYIRVPLELQDSREQLTVRFALIRGTIPLFSGEQAAEFAFGVKTQVQVPLQPVVGSLEQARQVVAGWMHSCALDQHGLTFCWGRAAVIGTEQTSNPTPTPLTLWPRFVEITAGARHMCGRTQDGEAWCWGWNAMGQLGDGTRTDRALPVMVSASQPFESIAAGAYNTCGLTASGQALCWGGNGRNFIDDVGGPLGYDPPEICPVGDAYFGDVECSTVPRAVNGGLNFRQVTSGAFHSCGVTTAGAGYCWGWNQLGALGLGADTAWAYQDPQRVQYNGTFAAIQAGPSYSCGLDPSGRAICWGNISDGTVVAFDNGQLGDGRFDGNAVPEPVSGGHTFRALAASNVNSVDASTTCGLITDNVAYCWGINDRGQLGAPGGETCPGGGDCRSTPAPVSGQPAFTGITVGENHACGLTANGELYCWGGNELGQVGDGSTTDRYTPVRVSPPSAATVPAVTHAESTARRSPPQQPHPTIGV
jgi:alpha-tubulin suppressor-like RCC1 family protein